MQDTLSMTSRAFYNFARFINESLAVYKKCRHSGQRCYPSRTDNACVECFEKAVDKHIENTFEGVDFETEPDC